MDAPDFQTLTKYLAQVPAVNMLSTGVEDNGLWWVKLKIDIRHELAWHVVQEFGCVLNYLSMTERLPTVFYPVSPAPYLNGGPQYFLSWIIENTNVAFTPVMLAKWLENRLPRPVANREQWQIDDLDDDPAPD